MKYKGHNPKRDANELEIVQALEKVGCSVMRLDKFDLLVGLGGKDYKMEVKRKNGRLTESQKAMMRDWAGTPLYVVRSVADAYKVLGFVK